LKRRKKHLLWKKEAKNFYSFGSETGPRVLATHQIDKSFLLLFFKKEDFLLLPLKIIKAARPAACRFRFDFGFG